MKPAVLITGASKGIGQAIAVALAADYEVVIHYGYDQQGAAATLALVEAQHGHGRIIQFDVANRDRAKQVLSADIEEHGVYYGVICNAGIYKDAPLAGQIAADWDTIIRTNLDGFYNTVHPLLMPMIMQHQSGRILAVSSVSGIIGNRGQAAYAASKAGIIAACKSLALELAGRKITVNCVAPGLIETKHLDPQLKENLLSHIPLKRCGTPAEVAALLRFLLSAEAAYITKQVIAIDGGLS